MGTTRTTAAAALSLAATLGGCSREQDRVPDTFDALTHAVIEAENDTARARLAARLRAAGARRGAVREAVGAALAALRRNDPATQRGGAAVVATAVRRTPWSDPPPAWLVEAEGLIAGLANADLDHAAPVLGTLHAIRECWPALPNPDRIARLCGRGLSHADPAVRVAALALAGELGPDAEPARQALLTATTDANPLHRAHAIRAISYLEPRRADEQRWWVVLDEESGDALLDHLLHSSALLALRRHAPSCTERLLAAGLDDRRPLRIRGKALAAAAHGTDARLAARIAGALLGSELVDHRDREWCAAIARAVALADDDTLDQRALRALEGCGSVAPEAAAAIARIAVARGDLARARAVAPVLGKWLEAGLRRDFAPWAVDVATADGAAALATMSGAALERDALTKLLRLLALRGGPWQRPRAAELLAALR